jgi:hypothetical protein
MGSVVTINIRDLPNQLRKDEGRLREAIARGARAGAERGRAFIAKKTPIDLGQLKVGWKVKASVPKIPESGELTLTTLVNDAPHAGVVELGARPHAVNPAGWAAIYEWVRRHPELYVRAGRKNNAAWQGPNKPRTRSPKREAGPMRPFHGPDPEIAAITNAIVWKIRHHGQKPTYFIRRNLDGIAKAMLMEIARAIAVEADAARRG